MPLRLIEMVLPAEHLEEAEELLAEYSVIDVWHDTISANQAYFKILAQVEDTEALIDRLEKYYGMLDGFRIVLLPVTAAIPRIETTEEFIAKKESVTPGQNRTGRVSREELYVQISHSVKLTRVYLVMVTLSAIVAAIGILNNNVAVVIGAMVIAPLLGPNVSLSLATTLGDTNLAQTSIKANVIGLLTPLLLSMLLGLILQVNPNIPEIASRTYIGLGDMALALASGSAGALAFTTGVPTILIGVMVAVALLPPVVTLGLLIGSGHFQLALGAMLLLLTNIICVNLAGVVTFLAQGIRPLSWWEVGIAQRTTRWAIIIWATLLVILVLAIYLSRYI
ncbi:MAG: TIGR00341 family protein [Deltaproteobacteria bacterium]|nr:TIGR00341 family protein [Deltaproteobacteria bacterium]MBW1952125.1 TIGR00341 family protein [Deltaproteobacteria bacterium]MBW1986186.1 TIGR00341 family protein [Deltaproteobacteria bacterium]MBW2134940.1 TIGR00341 family protein [Deltaproteobacteria bacterium]